MARFGDLGIESGAIIGKGIEIEELFGKRILIEKTKISKSKFTGKNNSGLRLHKCKSFLRRSMKRRMRTVTSM